MIRNIRLSTSCIHQVRYFWSKKNKPSKVPCKEDAIPKAEPEEKIPASWSQPKIVVIGAGIAGLSAAQRLVKCGLCDITILEATERPGGRIQSCWFTNSVAELGASTIQGACAANSAYNLAVMERLVHPPLPRSPTNTGWFFTSRGNPIDSGIAHRAFITFREVESSAIAQYGRDLNNDDVNLHNFMDSRIKSQLKNFPESERQIALMVINHYLSSLKDKLGTNLDHVNTKYYGSLPNLPGGSVRIPVGFIGVLAPLIRDIPECAIKYCRPVECIRWNICDPDRPRVCINVGDETYAADYVIVTTPLGFLKDRAQSFFTPNLSGKKLDAIRALGFGHSNNLYLQFPAPIWSNDDGNILFTWHPEDFSNTDSWIKSVSSLTVDHKSKQVLSAVISGRDAIRLETMSADQIMTDIQKLMQRFLGNPTIPRPTSILRSKWSTNMFTQGAFTYISTEAGVGHIKDLADPTPDTNEGEVPVILFAGEHTSTHNYATVHGARDSGIREANRIINYTKVLEGAPCIKPIK